MAWPQRGVLGAGLAVAACCLLIVVVFNGANDKSTTLEQEGIVSPGMEVYEVPAGRRRARTQSLSFQSKAQVAMGAMGGSDGRWPVPPPPPPTWTRGGHSWVYDGIYGNGQRPTTGVWGEGKFPPSSPAAQASSPAVEVVEQVTEPDGTTKDIIVPAQEVIAPPAAAAPQAQPVMQEPQPAVVAAPAPASVVEQVVGRNGQPEEIIVPAAAAPAPAPVAQAAPQPAAAAPAPAVEEECQGPSGPCQQIQVSVPAPVPTVMTSYIQSQPVAVPVPAPASAQLPMEWAAEDAAEHAYNLAQWRVKILKAKNDQAVLRKKLMELTMGGTDSGETRSRRGSRGRTGGGSSRSSGESSRGRGGKSDNRTAKELTDIKKSLLELAKETVGAIKGLKGQMEKLRKQACCKANPPAVVKKAATSQLSELPGVVSEKEKREALVLKLKKRMDTQLDTLLRKVTLLIKHGKQ